MKTKDIPEDLLTSILVNEVKKIGTPYNLVNFDLSYPSGKDFLFLKDNLSNFCDEKIDGAIKSSIACGYLEHSYISKERVLRLSDSGFSSGEYYILFANKKNARSSLKKISDWIDEHSGISNLLSLAISLAAFVVSMLSYWKN
jgi:hypothetical protein